MKWHGDMSCEHVATLSFNGDIALGVFVQELCDAEAVALLFSVSEANKITVAIRFNSEEARRDFEKRRR